MSAPPSSNIYNDLKQFVLEVINNDKIVIGKFFKYLESKTGIRRVYLLLGFLAFLALYLMVGYGVQFLSNVIGFIYPAYASMSAIESPDTRDDTKWLTYWVVFSLFACLEYPFAFALQYIPFYFLLKCIFFAWLFLPVMNGANVLYNNLIRPFFIDVSKDVDKNLAKTVAAGAASLLKRE